VKVGDVGFECETSVAFQYFIIETNGRGRRCLRVRLTARQVSPCFFICRHRVVRLMPSSLAVVSRLP